METKELLEQLVKEVAAQNKLIALLIGIMYNIDDKNAVPKKELFNKANKDAAYLIDLLLLYK